MTEECKATRRGEGDKLAQTGDEGGECARQTMAASRTGMPSGRTDGSMWIGMTIIAGIGMSRMLRRKKRLSPQARQSGRFSRRMGDTVLLSW